MFRKISILGIFLLICVGVLSQPADRDIKDVLSDLRKTSNINDKATLLLELALAYVHKPGEFSGDLDSALLLTRQAELINNDNLHDKAIEAKIYFTYSNDYREKGDTAIGHAYINKSINIYETIDLPSEDGEAYLELSSYMPLENSDDARKKINVFEKALALFKMAGNIRREADVLKNLADFNQLIENFGEALVQLREAQALYSSIDYKEVQGVYDLMNSVSESIGDYTNAINYGLLAVKTAEEVGDTSLQLCTIYNRLAIAYGDWSKEYETNYYFKKAMIVAEKYNDKPSIDMILVSVCTGLLKQNNWKESLSLIREAENKLRPLDLYDSLFLSQCYTNSYVKAELYDRAKTYVSTLTGMIPRLKKDDMTLRSVFLPLNYYYYETKRYKLARKYAVEFSSLANRVAYKPDIIHALLLEARVDSALGNLPLSISEFVRYDKAKDSLLNEAKSFQINQLQVVYESDKKEKDIDLLTSQNNAKAATLRKARLIRNIIIASSVLLLSLFYLAYRYKQKHNLKLQLQQDKINEQNHRLGLALEKQKKLIVEKEWLIKEIHHRVKNNLQIVISLLNTQSYYLDNPSALAAIQESRERMQAIALIHQRLYRVDNTTQINMPTYVDELADSLKSGLTQNNIRFQLEVDNINLDISQAVPVGLILNEAITNSIKYAFPENKEGNVLISLKSNDDHQIHLVISDNGKGLPANFNIEKSNSLGLQLVKLLSEQLDGDLKFMNKNGLKISLFFKQTDYEGIGTVA